jgi:hypothetical protein
MQISVIHLYVPLYEVTALARTAQTLHSCIKNETAAFEVRYLRARRGACLRMDSNVAATLPGSLDSSPA